MKNVTLLYVNLFLGLFMIMPISSFAKGRTPKTRSIVLTQATEFCHNVGCLTVGPGEVEIYDFPKPELFRVTLTKSIKLAGIPLPEGTELRFKHSQENPYDEPSLSLTPLLHCDFEITDSLNYLHVDVVGITFMASKDVPLCIGSNYGKNPFKPDFDYIVIGMPLVSGIPTTMISGLPIATRKKVTIAIRSGYFTSEKPEDHRLISGTLARDHIMNFPEGIGVYLKEGDFIDFYDSVFIVHHEDDRILQFGYMGSYPTYMSSKGKLTSFLAGPQEEYNEMKVEAGTGVYLYETGQVRSAKPQKDTIQRVQNLNIGHLTTLGYSHGHPYVYFWPNGLIQFTQLQPTGHSGIRIARSLLNEFKFNNVHGTSSSIYRATLAYNPDGVLKAAFFDSSRGDSYSYGKVGNKDQDEHEELVNMTKEWREKYIFFQQPSAKLVEFLENGE